ncbi:MAG TPA: hypothetical protein VMH27_07970 [Puia sp.]|nr:hypothetical protein [Puia sp.]
MKKTKVFMVAGTLALAISAIFATKANKKFTPSITTAYVALGSQGFYVISSSAVFTTRTPNVKVGLEIFTHQTGSFVLQGQGTLVTKTDGATNTLWYE